MIENLDNRKKRILQAIIEEYIDTAEPVSSGNLVKELNCSSATIRNEMAELRFNKNSNNNFIRINTLYNNCYRT